MNEIINYLNNQKIDLKDWNKLCLLAIFNQSLIAWLCTDKFGIVGLIFGLLGVLFFIIVFIVKNLIIK
jgi:hypothetical protein